MAWGIRAGAVVLTALGYAGALTAFGLWWFVVVIFDRVRARRRARRGHAALRRGRPPGRRAGGDHRCHHDGGVVAVPHRPGRRRARRPRQQRRARPVPARSDRRVDRRHRGRPAARGDRRQPLAAVVPILVVRCGRAGGARWLHHRGTHPHPEPAVGDRDVRRRAPRRRRLLVGRRRGAGAGLPGARRRQAPGPTGPPVQHVGARHRDRPRGRRRGDGVDHPAGVVGADRHRLRPGAARQGRPRGGGGGAGRLQPLPPRRVDVAAPRLHGDGRVGAAARRGRRDRGAGDAVAQRAGGLGRRRGRRACRWCARST